MQIHGRYLKPIIGQSLFHVFRFPVTRQEKQNIHFLILQKFSCRKKMCNDNNMLA